MSQKRIDSLKAFHRAPKKISIDDNLQIVNEELETKDNPIFEEIRAETSLSELHQELETLESDFQKFLIDLEKAFNLKANKD